MCRNHKKTLVVHSLVGHFFPPLPQFFSLSLSYKYSNHFTYTMLFSFACFDSTFLIFIIHHHWMLGRLENIHDEWIMSWSFLVRDFSVVYFPLVREDIETTQNFRNRRVMYWCYTCRVPNILFNETCLLKFGHWKQWKSWIASVNSLRGSDSGATLNKDSVRFFRPQCRSTGKNEL